MLNGGGQPASIIETSKTINRTSKGLDSRFKFSSTWQATGKLESRLWSPRWGLLGVGQAAINFVIAPLEVTLELPSRLTVECNKGRVFLGTW